LRLRQRGLADFTVSVGHLPDPVVYLQDPPKRIRLGRDKRLVVGGSTFWAEPIRRNDKNLEKEYVGRRNSKQELKRSAVVLPQLVEFISNLHRMHQLHSSPRWCVVYLFHLQCFAFPSLQRVFEKLTVSIFSDFHLGDLAIRARFRKASPELSQELIPSFYHRTCRVTRSLCGRSIHILRAQLLTILQHNHLEIFFELELALFKLLAAKQRMVIICFDDQPLLDQLHTNTERRQLRLGNSNFMAAPALPLHQLVKDCWKEEWVEDGKC
jgi:hypothetical protein